MKSETKGRAGTAMERPRAPRAGRLGAAMWRGLSTGCVFAVAMLTVSCGMGIAFAGMNEGMALCLSCVSAGVSGGLLQQLWFNPRVLGARLSYPVRIALFAICYLGVLAACAQLGAWLPPLPEAWASFVACYLVILAVLTVAYTVRYRSELHDYEQSLNAYRAQRAKTPRS